MQNRAFKETLGEKMRMLTPEETEKQIGHAVGGVCPFGAAAGVRIFLDDSLCRFESVFPACGSSDSAIEVTLHELEQLLLRSAG